MNVQALYSPPLVVVFVTVEDLVFAELVAFLAVATCVVIAGLVAGDGLVLVETIRCTTGLHCTAGFNEAVVVFDDVGRGGLEVGLGVVKAPTFLACLMAEADGTTGLSIIVVFIGRCIMKLPVTCRTALSGS